MARPNTYIPVEEPIDYARLSEAYRRLKWRWFDGLPSPDGIQKAIASIKRSAAGRYCQSGGLQVDRGVVSLHRKLFTFYILPVPVYEREDLEEEGDWAAKIR